jgi:hypothetical protein
MPAMLKKAFEPVAALMLVAVLLAAAALNGHALGLAQSKGHHSLHAALPC